MNPGFRSPVATTPSPARNNAANWMAFSQGALDSILDMLGKAKASFYLVGEIADWYPEVPRKVSSQMGD